MKDCRVYTLDTRHFLGQRRIPLHIPMNTLPPRRLSSLGRSCKPNIPARGYVCDLNGKGSRINSPGKCTKTCGKLTRAGFSFRGPGHSDAYSPIAHPELSHVVHTLSCASEQPLVSKEEPASQSALHFLHPPPTQWCSLGHRVQASGPVDPSSFVCGRLDGHLVQDSAPTIAIQSGGVDGVDETPGHLLWSIRESLEDHVPCTRTCYSHIHSKQGRPRRPPFEARKKWK